MRPRAIRFDFPRFGMALAATMLFVGGVPSAATTETFVPTTIQYPGASSTIARGINNNGEIVGNYPSRVKRGHLDRMDSCCKTASTRASTSPEVLIRTRAASASRGPSSVTTVPLA